MNNPVCNIFLSLIQSQQCHVSHSNRSFCSLSFVYAAMFFILSNDFPHRTTHIVVQILTVFIHSWRKSGKGEKQQQQ